MIEKAGGVTSNGEKSILEVQIDGLNQMINFIGGSKNDVEKVRVTLKEQNH